LCVHPALHADTQPAAFFKRGSARFRIFGSKLDIGHHTLFIIYKQLCGLFQNVRKHRRDNSAPCLAVLDKYIIMLGGELNASLAQNITHHTIVVNIALNFPYAETLMLRIKQTSCKKLLCL